MAALLVILTNHDGRDDHWSKSKIRLELQKHAWPWDNIEPAIETGLRWEILKWQSGYLKFFRDRVQIVEETRTVDVMSEVGSA